MKSQSFLVRLCKISHCSILDTVLKLNSGMVYDDAEKLYSEVRKDGETLLEEAFSALFPKSIALGAASIPKTSGEIVGFNTTFFPRRDVVEIPLSGAPHLKSKVVQASKDGSTGYALLDCSAGGHLAQASGLFANSMPPSGPSSYSPTLSKPLIVFFFPLLPSSVYERL